MMTTNYQKTSITVLMALFCMLVAVGPINGNYAQFADAAKVYHGQNYGKSYHNTGGLSNVQILHCVTAATANGGNSHGGTGGNSNGGNGGSSNGGNGGAGGNGGSGTSGGNGGNGGPGGISSGGDGGTSSGGTSHGGSSSASSASTCSIS
jgi:hypothetical protein